MVDVEANGTNSERPDAGGKSRSETPYPYFGLSHAIEMVQAIRKAGGKDAALDAVMKEMGIAKSTDRRWAYGVPSAVLYGLVERVGRGDTGRLKVTDLALRLTNPASVEAGRNAKIAALKTPTLYANLLESFAGAPQPTREGLKNLLFTDYGIVESMAMMAADAFLDAIKTAEVLTPSGEISLDMAPAPVKEKTEDTGAHQAMHVPAAFIKHVFQLRRDMQIVVPLPPDLTPKDVGRLHKWLQTLPIEEEGGDQKPA